MHPSPINPSIPTKIKSNSQFTTIATTQPPTINTQLLVLMLTTTTSSVDGAIQSVVIEI